MAQRTNYWKLGLFVVAGVSLFLVLMVVLGASSLKKETVSYETYFDESVQGLEVGSPVKFRGVSIGTVAKIDVAPDHRMVEVANDLTVEEIDRLGLSKPGENGKGKRRLGLDGDMRVQLESMGLTGVKFLELDFFALDTPKQELSFTPPANYIPSTPSTIKSLEENIVRVMNKLPEITAHADAILVKVDTIAGQLQDANLSTQIVQTLDSTNGLLLEARKKVEQVDTGAISKETQHALNALNETVARVNRILVKVDADKGLLASILRTSDAFGDSAHEMDGLGGHVQDTLIELQSAARSIKKLADTLERDPDMLLKGRSRGPVKDR